MRFSYFSPSRLPSGVRRPKHIVLSDTLSLLGKIKGALKGYETKVERLTEALAAANAARRTDHVAPTPAAFTASKEVMGAPPLTLMQPRIVKGEDLSLAPPEQQMSGQLSRGKSDAFLLAMPNVDVCETKPGTFRVSIRCMDRPDLQDDLAAGIGSLPVRITSAVFLPDAIAADFTNLELIVESTAAVTVDQLYSAFFMSVCSSGMLMMPLSPDDVDGDLNDVDIFRM